MEYDIYPLFLLEYHQYDAQSNSLDRSLGEYGSISKCLGGRKQMEDN